MAGEIVSYRTEQNRAVAELIRANLLGVNLRDYPLYEMLAVLAKYSPDEIESLASEHTVFVAMDGSSPVGCVCMCALGSGVFALRMMFVDPAHHRKGIGRRLLEKVEAEVAALGGGHIELDASFTAHAFYSSMGYADISSPQDDRGDIIPMVRNVEPHGDLKASIPTIQMAEMMLYEAEKMNPGDWVKHSVSCAKNAARIASKCMGMDETRAYVLGLMHDIGRREGVSGMRHIIDGYRYLRALGYGGVADICLTHSFVLPDIDTYFGAQDVSEEDKAFLRDFLRERVMTREDKLIQLCDAISMPQGAVLLEKRFVDVALRHGIYSFTASKWKGYYALKNEFDRQTGINIYELFDEIVKNSI